MRRRLLGVVGVWAVGLVFMRGAVVPPEHCPTPSVAALGRGAAAAADWIARGQRADGSYLYEYDRAEARPVDDYNVVRHAGVTMSLYQYLSAGVGADPALLANADRGLDWMLARRVTWGDRAGLAGGPGEDARLGATALMVAGLLQRREATGDRSHDATLQQLARGIVAQQQPDGSMLDRTDSRTGRPVPVERSLYSTGEAFWALTLLDRAFPDGGYEAPARRVAAYIATRRDADQGVRHPPWADQWAAYGFGEMAGWGLTPEEVDYVRRLTDRFGFLVRGEAQRASGGIARTIRGGEGRGAGFGTVAEAMGSLWRVSAFEPALAGERDTIARRLDCAAGILVERQQDEADAARWPQPDAVVGAWYRADRTRMDDQQHPLSALVRAIDRAREREGDG